MKEEQVSKNASVLFHELQKVILEIKNMEIRKEEYSDKKVELMWTYIKTLMTFKNPYSIKQQLSELKEINNLLNEQIYQKTLEKQQLLDERWNVMKEYKAQSNRKL